MLQQTDRVVMSTTALRPDPNRVIYLESIMAIWPMDNSPIYIEQFLRIFTRSQRLLRKRLFLIEKLKDAHTVGLVIGSVGVHRHRDAVQRMRTLCKVGGKKIYVISVGKINVPKLSNFSSDIDIFVLLSCPFGVLLDSSDFYRPVLSFFEAEVALNAGRSWAADFGWSADFSTCLNDEIVEEKNDEKGDVSLVSGKVRIQHKNIDEKDGTSSTIALYTAGDYFKERSWKGLDDGVRVDEDTTIQEGRSGIAQDYEGK
ncbi:unnamed protein product [Caenorhabditis bovis]|uniref:2-(3-amino-3-carboxypropyl)histidine synthase subunit 2 n=1 Tax=Caenorhabditis bovis TaxID=2654633 RepID=A0A8S1EYP3_9PELO|nr:unnamed protein product [Caenorhabditis bovis]